MVKTFLQTLGSNLVIGLEGKKQNILREFYSFQTFGATTAAHFLSERFLYFWSTHTQLIEAYAKKLESKVYNEVGIEFKNKKINSYFILSAIETIKNIPKEEFFKPSILDIEYAYSEKDVNKSRERSPHFTGGLCL